MSTTRRGPYRVYATYDAQRHWMGTFASEFLALAFASRLQRVYPDAIWQVRAAALEPTATFTLGRVVASKGATHVQP